MTKLKVHILYEYSADLRPHGSSYLRLLRPLTHPIIQKYLEVSYSRHLPNYPVDVIILDRFWRSFDITIDSAKALVKNIKANKSKFLYSFDDNFQKWVNSIQPLTSSREEIFNYFIEKSDGIIVSTAALFEEFHNSKPNALHLPNMLDERLLIPANINNQHTFPIRIGYMGTPTHDGDLRLIIPVIQRLHEIYKEKIIFEIVGALKPSDLPRIPEWQSVPVRVIAPRSSEIEYPLFMLWFTQFIHWDIALAPLADTPFNSYKSDIKLLDYAAIGAAGIFSKSRPYESSVNNGINGLLVENQFETWVTAIKEVIENRDQRESIQRNAYNYLYENRTLAKKANLWVDGIYKLFETESSSLVK